MISFFICLALLIGGYFVYGKVVENTFAPDDRETPAVKINDGVDYVVMPQWKLFLVQLLNIAGLGPIFGAMQGALWGPVVFLWITFGTIFAGGVHDYFSGMLSERNNGASISEVIGQTITPIMASATPTPPIVLEQTSYIAADCPFASIALSPVLKPSVTSYIEHPAAAHIRAITPSATIAP